MTDKLQDILLVGFGAIGTMHSLVLKRSGRVRLTVVARSNFETVNSQGVYIKSPQYGNFDGWRPDRFVKSIPEALDRSYSFVVLSSKAIPELESTRTLLFPLLTAPCIDQHPQPAYVLFQNGLNVERDLYKMISEITKGEPRVISTCIWLGANSVEKNVVRQTNDFIQKSHSTPPLLSEFASLLEAGGTTVTVVPNIQCAKFTKNFWNVAFSTFAALSRYPATAIFRHSNEDDSMPTPYLAPVTAHLLKMHTVPIIRATLEELVALGRALGFSESDIPSSMAEDTIQFTIPLHTEASSVHKPSMLMDLEMGNPMEVEVIVGEVVRMSQAKGVDVPHIETIYALLLIVQNQLLRILKEKRSPRSASL